MNPVSADYLIDELERANDEQFDAVVVLLDTPGGLAESMRDIVKAELESNVPVIVYVSPDGARAASAGVWIGQAADVLAMAPQTNIGSSTPVSSSGEDIPADLRRKVVNDAAGSLRALAEEHGRNAEWAERAVRRASNLTAREALEMNVIDLIALDLDALLTAVDGTTTVPRELTLRTAGAEVTAVDMSLWKRILDTLIDPNLVVLFMSLGLLGLTVELFNPGLIFPGAFGAISLVIGFFGLHVLPINWAGILLLLLAAGFLIAEVLVTSTGILALVGATSFVFGALLLFDPAGDASQVSLPVAIGVAALLALFFIFAMTKVVAARSNPVRTGEQELEGELALVREDLDPDGRVFAHGELWAACVPADERVAAGETVRVDRLREGLVLEVTPVDPSEASNANLPPAAGPVGGTVGDAG